MGVPTLEVGYTSAATGRGDHEVHKGHVVALGFGGGTSNFSKVCAQYSDCGPMRANDTAEGLYSSHKRQNHSWCHKHSYDTNPDDDD
jgi:hypothetical protein